jgi:hypothetical protein
MAATSRLMSSWSLASSGQAQPMARLFARPCAEPGAGNTVGLVGGTGVIGTLRLVQEPYLRSPGLPVSSRRGGLDEYNDHR